MRPFFEIRVGERIWLDGQGWDVAELTGTSVRLRSGSSVRLLSIASLTEAAPPAIGDDDMKISRCWTAASCNTAAVTRMYCSHVS